MGGHICVPETQSILMHCKERRICVRTERTASVSFEVTYLFSHVPDDDKAIVIQASLGGGPTTTNRAMNGPGPYPVLRLDSFDLPGLDLLFLGVNPYHAIRGARDHISLYRPVIALDPSEFKSVELLRSVGYERVHLGAFAVYHG